MAYPEHPVAERELISYRQSWAAGGRRGQLVTIDRDEALAIVDELLELRKQIARQAG